MAFVHCHSCPWSQDDFWEVDGYNPFRKDILEDWVKKMKEGIADRKSIGMDQWWAQEAKIPYQPGKKGVDIDFRDYLAWELRRKANNIEKMKWITWKDFKNDPNPVCPNCGSDNLDID